MYIKKAIIFSFKQRSGARGLFLRGHYGKVPMLSPLLPGARKSLYGAYAAPEAQERTLLK